MARRHYRAWVRIVHPTTGGSHVVEGDPRESRAEALEDLAQFDVNDYSKGKIQVREVSPWRNASR